MSNISAIIMSCWDATGSWLLFAPVCALRARRIGRELSAADAWIAATAVLLNCPLLSHDRDFGNLPGLEVIHYDSPADDAQH